MQHYIGTIDQGTTSSRFILFDRHGHIVASSQLEHRQIFPQPGWVEHDPLEIIDNVKKTIADTLAQVPDFDFSQPLPVGITNQRETVVLWNKKTGKPYYSAIVWQDMRGRDLLDSCLTGFKDGVHPKTGLIPAPYFSASKIAWLLRNLPSRVPGFSEAVQKGEAAVGTIDSWILWNLTGAAESSPHVTDVTNASRYLLMDIQTLQWDPVLLRLFDIPLSLLPTIVPSVPRQPYGTGSLPTPGGTVSLSFCGILGDQQAALFGQGCFASGASKCTYGTGGFLLMNIGNRPLLSKNGILTTVAYQKEGENPLYAFEGSVAVAGSLVQWIRDNLGLIQKASEVDQLAMAVDDCGGVYFVPAFAGLFAPYWRPRARGVICGLTGYARREHLCRAVLESTAFQVYDLFLAIMEDSAQSQAPIRELRVDGGMTVSTLLMQMQADLLQLPIIRPKVIETTALGAAYAAGLSAGVWSGTDELQSQWEEDRRWLPNMSETLRSEKLQNWKKAVERSFGWVQ